MSAAAEVGSGAKTVVPMHPAQPAAAKPAAAPRSAFVPLLLFGLAVLVMLGFQAWSLAGERSALITAFDGQQQTVDNAGRLRASLDGLAADTQRLADRGNASAALLVTELKQRGITINPPSAAASAAR